MFLPTGTIDDSFHGRPGKWDPNVPKIIIDWAKEMIDG